MKKMQVALQVVHRLGGFRLLDSYWGADRITVLAHHRVTADVNRPDYPYLQPVVSATPEMFERQLAYVAERFSVISLEDLVQFVVVGRALPPRPLLITFDDGFRDNYTHAYPILRKYGFPAVIFLMTSRMEHSIPAWWDECAYYFYHTTLDRALLPLVGEQDLSTPVSRRAARNTMTDRLKQVPESTKLATLGQIGVVLQVAPPPIDPALFMGWGEVRELVNNGIACMPHTVTHPILTRTDPAQQEREIVDSRDRIHEETGAQMVAFAYPNGGVHDYDGTTLRILREAGFKLAFTLMPGPTHLEGVRRRPLEIPRVFLSYRDSMDQFVGKILGIPALMHRAQHVE